MDLTDLTWVPDQTYLVDTHWLPTRLQVLIAMAAGGMAPGHIARNLERGSTISTLLTEQDDLSDLLELSWPHRLDTNSLLVASIRTAMRSDDPAEKRRRERVKAVADALSSLPLA